MSARVRGVEAAVVAVLCCLALLVASAVPARAADTGTLTIVKTWAPGQTGAGTPVEGATLTVQRILGVDPTSPEQLNAIVAEDPTLLAGRDPHRLGPALTATTDAQGRAVLRGLPDGVYLVRETARRSGDEAWSVVAPFLVAVPMRIDGVETRDVTVHAKNELVTVDLTMTPGAVRPGDEVTTLVSGSVPEPDGRGRLARHSTVLTLDRRLAFRSVAGVRVRTDAGDTVLVEGTDWTWVHDETAHAVRVDLTPAGLARLAALRAGHPETRVLVDVRSVVTEGVHDGDRLGATAHLFVDGYPVPEDLAQLDAASAADAQAQIRVVLPEGPDPTATATPGRPGDPVPGTPTATARPSAPAVSAPDPDRAPPGLPDLLARTGITLTHLLIAAGLALVAGGVLLLARRRREEAPADPDRPRAPAADTPPTRTTGTTEETP